MILTVCPAPTSPQCVTSLAMWRSSGAIRSKVGAVAPTMMESVPSMAA